MGDRKHRRRSNHASNDHSARPILERALSEAAVDDLLAYGDGKYHGEKRQALRGVLRKDFQSDVWKEALNGFRMRGQAAQTDELICENQRCQKNRDDKSERRAG